MINLFEKLKKHEKILTDGFEIKDGGKLKIIIPLKEMLLVQTVTIMMKNNYMNL